MANRLELHQEFTDILGTEYAYFQPPKSVKMNYPAIRYSLKRLENTHANNQVYRQETAYDVIVIDEDPESEVAKKVSLMPMCTFDRFYTSDNLNHFVFTLYH